MISTIKKERKRLGSVIKVFLIGRKRSGSLPIENTFSNYYERIGEKPCYEDEQEIAPYPFSRLDVPVYASH